jgi:hypothetical protein
MTRKEREAYSALLHARILANEQFLIWSSAVRRRYPTSRKGYEPRNLFRHNFTAKALCRVRLTQTLAYFAGFA